MPTANKNSNNTPMMTPEQWAAKMDERLRKWEEDKVYISAIQGTIGAMVKRVFNSGLNSRGNKIGQYSTKPMLATKKQFADKSKFKQSFSSSGISITKKKVVKKRKVGNRKLWIKFKGASRAVPIMVLEGGYKQFRQIQGRESSFVNLKFRSELFLDIASANLTKVTGGYDFSVKKNINALKIKGLTKRFGDTPIFHLTKEERIRFKDNLRSEFTRRISA